MAIVSIKKVASKKFEKVTDREKVARLRRHENIDTRVHVVWCIYAIKKAEATGGEMENADRKEYRERKRETDGGRRSELC